MASPTKIHPSLCAEVAENCFAFNLRRADRLVTQLYDEALRPTQLKITQFSLLLALRGMEPVTLSKLAEVVGADRTTLTRNIDVLLSSGLVERQTGKDLRERYYAVTKDGHESLHDALPLWKAAQRKVEAMLGKNVAANLVRDLSKIT